MRFRQIQVVIEGAPTILSVWSDGPYKIVPLENEPNFCYIAGNDGINAISLPMQSIRSIWNVNQAADIMPNLPVDTVKEA